MLGIVGLTGVVCFALGAHWKVEALCTIGAALFGVALAGTGAAWLVGLLAGLLGL